MGYSTDFEGTLKFNRELSASEIAQVSDWLNDDMDTPRSDELADKLGYEKGSKFRDGYVDLEINKEFSGLKWNGAEKTYGMVDSLNVILHGLSKFEPPVSLEGSMMAYGEERSDVWKIEIKDGKAVRVEVK